MNCSPPIWSPASVLTFTEIVTDGVPTVTVALATEASHIRTAKDKPTRRSIDFSFWTFLFVFVVAYQGRVERFSPRIHLTLIRTWDILVISATQRGFPLKNLSIWSDCN